MSALFKIRSALNLKPGSQVAVYEGPGNYGIYEVLQLMPFSIVAPIILQSNEDSLTINSRSQYIPNAGVKDSATDKLTPVSVPNPLSSIATLSHFTVMLIMGIAWDSPSVVLSAYDPGGTPYWYFLTHIYSILEDYTRTDIIYVGDKMHEVGDKIYAPDILFAAFPPNLIPTFSFSRNYSARNVIISFDLYLYGYIVKYKKDSIKTTSNAGDISNLPLIYLYSPAIEVYSR
ncbi:hypothetical protein [Metallosphaera cuprina]|uniref:Uncharacterized protein n=1 Tax=Metallosphaera cuprina (strain Ar-4) TaxID=1006006 RepID=F4G2J2_METCR|nr:hypothetical protein [Metallosphaera cuprina]AEB95040.1 hypothetical protein Mcup_0935 [Metallosphaera cuprina Ar-4]